MTRRGAARDVAAPGGRRDLKGAAVGGADAAGTARRGRTRDEGKDRAIVQAMLAMLVEHGFDGASFEKVAAAAQVSRATIYRRWTSKEALVIHAADLLLRYDETQRPDNRPGLAALKDKIAAFAAQLRDPFKARVLAVLIAEASGRPRLAELLTQLERDRREPMVRSIAEAVRLGEIRPPDDVDEAIDAIVGPVYFRGLIVGRQTSRAQSDAIIDRVLVRG